MIVSSYLTFPLISFFQLQTSASPCDAAVHVGVDNDVTDPQVDADHTDGVNADDVDVDHHSMEVTDPPVDADHTDAVIDDAVDVDPHSMEIENHNVSKVSIYFYVFLIL